MGDDDGLDVGTERCTIGADAGVMGELLLLGPARRAAAAAVFSPHHQPPPPTARAEREAWRAGWGDEAEDAGNAKEGR